MGTAVVKSQPIVDPDEDPLEKSRTDARVLL